MVVEQYSRPFLLCLSTFELKWKLHYLEIREFDYIPNLYLRNQNVRKVDEELYNALQSLKIQNPGAGIRWPSIMVSRKKEVSAPIHAVIATKKSQQKDMPT